MSNPDNNNNNNSSNTKSTSSQSQSTEQLRWDLARDLDSLISNFGGSIGSEWDEIKRFVASEIRANLSDAVRRDVGALLEHPQLRELVRRLRVGRTDTETQSEVLDKMTATMLPKVRRSHRQFLNQLNQQVSQMIIQLMRNDQLAAVIDDERLLHQLFRLAAGDDELSSQRT